MANERKCQWCGSDISHRDVRAKFCGPKCVRKSEWSRSVAKNGPSNKNCVECGNKFIALRSAITCSKECSTSRHKSKTRQWADCNPEQAAERCRKWRSENLEHVRNLSRRNYKSDPERHRGYCSKWRWENIDSQRERELENSRSRAADRALSMILLPVTEPPKGKHHDI